MNGGLMEWRAAALLAGVSAMISVTNAYSGHAWNSGFCAGIAAALALTALISYGHHKATRETASGTQHVDTGGDGAGC